MEKAAWEKNSIVQGILPVTLEPQTLVSVRTRLICTMAEIIRAKKVSSIYYF